MKNQGQNAGWGSRLRNCEFCGLRYHESEGCPQCKPRQCSQCGNIYRGQTQSCPVCTGAHYPGDRTQGPEPANGRPQYHSFYRRYIQPTRRRLETTLAAYWPTGLFEFTPVQREFLQDCLQGNKAPVILDDLRAVRWLATRMEKLDFRHAQFVDLKCLRHLVKIPKSLWLFSLEYVESREARMLAEHRDALYFKPPRPLTEAIAKELAQHRGRLLSLWGCKQLDVQVAAKLASHTKRLQLHGLTELRLDIAEQLRRHQGTRLGFPSVTQLNPEVAAELARYQGHTLYFNSIEHPPSETLRAFEVFGGSVKFGKGTWAARDASHFIK